MIEYHFVMCMKPFVQCIFTWIKLWIKIITVTFNSVEKENKKKDFESAMKFSHINSIPPIRDEAQYAALRKLNHVHRRIANKFQIEHEIKWNWMTFTSNQHLSSPEKRERKKKKIRWFTNWLFFTRNPFISIEIDNKGIVNKTIVFVLFFSLWIFFSVVCLFPSYCHRPWFFDAIRRFHRIGAFVVTSTAEFLCPSEIKCFLLLGSQDWMVFHRHFSVEHECVHDGSIPLHKMEMIKINLNSISQECAKVLRIECVPCCVHADTAYFQCQFEDLTQTAHP